MTNLVIDSNLLLASAFVEPHSPQARALLAKAVHAGDSFHAPALLQYEIVTVIRKAVHFGRINEAEGQSIKNLLLATEIKIHVNLDLINRGYELAQAFHLPRAYDTQYVALAEHLNCDFWTADERLFNSVRATFPSIHWLGQFEG